MVGNCPGWSCPDMLILWCWSCFVLVFHRECAASMSLTRWTSRIRWLFTKPWNSRPSPSQRLASRWVGCLGIQWAGGTGRETGRWGMIECAMACQRYCSIMISSVRCTHRGTADHRSQSPKLASRWVGCCWRWGGGVMGCVMVCQGSWAPGYNKKYFFWKWYYWGPKVHSIPGVFVGIVLSIPMVKIYTVNPQKCYMHFLVFHSSDSFGLGTKVALSSCVFLTLSTVHYTWKNSKPFLSLMLERRVMCCEGLGGGGGEGEWDGGWWDV